MATVPRHLFVPEHLRDEAYDDTPLPIGSGQTISQPYIVAYMTEALDVTAGQRVLEIGTGSGYQAAVLAEIGCEVFSIELVPELAEEMMCARAASSSSSCGLLESMQMALESVALKHPTMRSHGFDDVTH